MNYQKYAPWEHYPKTLRYAEMTNPLMVVKDFFSAGELKEQLNDLKRWRKCVITKKRYHNKNHSAADLVFLHELNLKLLEAAYLLLIGYQQDPWRLKDISDEQLAKEKINWVDALNSLSPNELLNPYKALKRIFKKISPQMYRDYLNEWLLSALRRKPVDEGLMSGEVICIYEHLQKLYEATWLIEQRQNKEHLQGITNP